MLIRQAILDAIDPLGLLVWIRRLDQAFGVYIRPVEVDFEIDGDATVVIDVAVTPASVDIFR